MFNIDVNKALANLEKSGVDEKLKAIDETIKEKMASIQSTDFKSLSPSAALSKMNDALNSVKSAAGDMLSVASDLEPAMTDLQTEVVKSLNSPTGQQDVQALLDKAGITKFKASDITDKISSQMSTPQLSGLDAAKDTASKLGKGLGGAFQVPGKGNIGIGNPGGLDFGKLIPKIKIKTETEYDLDGEPIGEKVIAIELGKPSNTPTIDSEKEPDPPIFEPKIPAQLLKNPYLANNGLISAIGRLPINKFEAPVTTVVQTDPSTGENIVFEAQYDENGEPVMVPSGFPSNEDFAARFEQGRNAAIGKMQSVMGQLKLQVGEDSKAFQDSARKLSEATNEFGNITVPKLDGIFNIKGIRNSKVDPVSGVSINVEELAKIEKELDKSLKPKLDQTGAAIELFFNQLGGGGPDNSGADV